MDARLGIHTVVGSSRRTIAHLPIAKNIARVKPMNCASQRTIRLAHALPAAALDAKTTRRKNGAWIPSLTAARIVLAVTEREARKAVATQTRAIVPATTGHTRHGRG